MLRLTFLACAVSLAVPAMAHAAAPAGELQAAQQQAAPQKEKKVCKVDTATGSIMPKRTCKTAAEWDAITSANRGVADDLRQMQQNDRTVSGNR